MASRRQYIDQAYLTSYLSGQALSSDYTSADDLISAAEEFIDSYAGYQRKWFQINNASGNGVYTPPDTTARTPINKEIRARVQTVVDPKTFTLQTYLQNAYQDGYFSLCVIEIIGGTGAGQVNHVADSTFAGAITVLDSWTTPLDTTSIYRIYQLGKFPRQQDVFFNSIDQPGRFYKTIPDEVRRAVAAQAAYMNSKGRDFFETDAATMQSEHVGAYGYTRLQGKGSADDLMIAPEARSALRGIIRRTGSINV